jgi:hypothetical protein
VSFKLAHEVTVFSSGHQAYESYTESPDCPCFESLAATFLALADARLSATQKLVLCMSAEALRHRKLTLTALSDYVSRRSDVPYSTVKWNVRSLVDMGLLNGGDTNNKGLLASMSATAKMLVGHLNAICDV